MATVKFLKIRNLKFKVVIDCEACDNEGEIKNDTKNIFALRYLNNML
jgi:hypothetical protein